MLVASRTLSPSVLILCISLGSDLPTGAQRFGHCQRRAVRAVTPFTVIRVRASDQ